MSKWLMQMVAPLLGVGFAFSGLLALGQQARAVLRDQEGYRVAFHAIDCPVPDGLTRDEFLGEVQYVASWPDDVPLLDDNLPGRLQKAFAMHPWVEQVRRVEVAADRHIHLDLVFRAPVLSVPTRSKGDDVASVTMYRGVDASGVLLPQSATDSGFKPSLASQLPFPGGRAGAVWDDVRVQTAVRTAVYLRPYQEQLGVEKYDFAGEDVIVFSRRGRVVWGRAPGAERSDEASAAVKLQRLLEASTPNPDGRDIRALPESDSRLVKSK
jgi:hypothetical protein